MRPLSVCHRTHRALLCSAPRVSAEGGHCFSTVLNCGWSSHTARIRRQLVTRRTASRPIKVYRTVDASRGVPIRAHSSQSRGTWRRDMPWTHSQSVHGGGCDSEMDLLTLMSRYGGRGSQEVTLSLPRCPPTNEVPVTVVAVWGRPMRLLGRLRRGYLVVSQDDVAKANAQSPRLKRAKVEFYGTAVYA